jgi:plasmid replication initiation protein
MKNNTVAKNNKIIEACYKLSTPELRLIYSCISKIDFKSIIDKDELFTISRDEYSTAFKIDKSNANRELKEAVNKLWDRELIIKNEGQEPFKTRWISRQAIFKNGNAEVRFSVDIIPYLTNLLEAGNFTKYKLENIGALKSSYSIRLYELLKQYEPLKRRIIAIDQLREVLCLGKKYNALKDLKKYVINLGINEINVNCDVRITYTNEFTGKKVTGFKFTIKSNQKKPKDNRKYLTPEQIEARSKPGESYPDLYDRLEKQGYIFPRTRRF